MGDIPRDLWLRCEGPGNLAPLSVQFGTRLGGNPLRWVLVAHLAQHRP
jgi:hypothetical protein